MCNKPEGRHSPLSLGSLGSLEYLLRNSLSSLLAIIITSGSGYIMKMQFFKARTLISMGG